MKLQELIDKCVGSRIWVVMKGDKGEPLTGLPLAIKQSVDDMQSLREHCSASTTMSVSDEV